MLIISKKKILINWQIMFCFKYTDVHKVYKEYGQETEYINYLI